jgi:hypothetical protein
MWKVWSLETKINSGLKQTYLCPKGGRVTAKTKNTPGRWRIFIRRNGRLGVRLGEPDTDRLA